MRAYLKARPGIRPRIVHGMQQHAESACRQLPPSRAAQQVCVQLAGAASSIHPSIHPAHLEQVGEGARLRLAARAVVLDLHDTHIPQYHTAPPCPAPHACMDAWKAAAAAPHVSANAHWDALSYTNIGWPEDVAGYRCTHACMRRAAPWALAAAAAWWAVLGGWPGWWWPQ